MAEHTCPACSGLRLSIADHMHAIRSAMRVAAAHPGTALAAGNRSQITTHKERLAALRRDLAIHLRDIEQKDAS